MRKVRVLTRETYLAEPAPDIPNSPITVSSILSCMGDKKPAPVMASIVNNGEDDGDLA